MQHYLPGKTDTIMVPDPTETPSEVEPDPLTERLLTLLLVFVAALFIVVLEIVDWVRVHWVRISNFVGGKLSVHSDISIIPMVDDGRGADQGEEDDRHSKEFQEKMEEQAEDQPRDEEGEFEDENSD